MKHLGLALMTLLFAACTADNYDTGDGKYSYLRADFVEAHTVASGKIDYAITDDGDSVSLNPVASASWATKRDSIYRALLYYNKVENSSDEAVGISRVPVLSYRQVTDKDTIHTDPLMFESAWISRNKKYFNIGFAIKTGKSDDTGTKQTIGMMCDSVVTNADGTHDLFLRMVHNQNGVPEYYTSHGFVSVSTHGITSGYTIHLSVNTYHGMVNKMYGLK